MQRPLCKICGTKHWSNEGHGWEKVIEGTVSRSGGGRSEKSDDPVEGSASRATVAVIESAVGRGPASSPVGGRSEQKSQEKDSGTYRYRDPDKRREYQKELMRKRRAM